MSIRISIKWPASLQGSGKLGQIQQYKSDILFEGGKAMQEVLADHMRALDATRSNKLGGKRTHFYKPENIHEPVVAGDVVSVPIYQVGITRALRDIVIFPKEARMLAIPLHADAYGMSPREYNTYYPKGTDNGLFMIKPKRSGKLLLAKNQGKNLVCMYVLKNSVTQRKDPTLLPSDEELKNACVNAICDAIKEILK